jgi:hypothetical protein
MGYFLYITGIFTITSSQGPFLHKLADWSVLRYCNSSLLFLIFSLLCAESLSFEVIWFSCCKLWSIMLVFCCCCVSNLRWNKLQDVIPPEIGELKSLTHLWVILFSTMYNLMLSRILFFFSFLEFIPLIFFTVIWVSMLSKEKSPRSLQFFLSFGIFIYMRIAFLGEFLQSWGHWKTFGTCMSPSSSQHVFVVF